MGETKTKKKPKIWLIILIIAVVLVGVIMLLPSDDSLGEGTSEESQETQAQAGEDSEDQNDDESADTDADEEAEETASASDRNLADPDQFPLGTCAELDGTTLVISIYADDQTTSWDMEDDKDAEMMMRMYGYLRSGFDWIIEQGKGYGKDITFVSDFMENPDLMYTANLDADFSDGQAHLADQKNALLQADWETKGHELMDKYGADNIMFVYYFNEPEDTQMVSGAAAYNQNAIFEDLPFDSMVLSPYVYGQEQGPATYAHETLHLFGAPDFYTPDVYGNNCGITQEFVDYCAENHANEIMTNNYDIYNMRVDLNKVTNDLTDLTAYYIGWIDSNPECDEWGVANSEHSR